MTNHIVVAFGFGVVFVVTLLVIAIAFPKPTLFQYNVFRIVLAIAAAGVAAVIPGFIDVELETTVGLILRAGGALAVFVIVFFFNPAKLATHRGGNDLSTDFREERQSQVGGKRSKNIQAGRDVKVNQ